MIQLNAEPGAYRTIKAGELHDMTSRGWRLIAVIERDEVEMVEEPMPIEAQPSLQQQAQQSSYCNNCRSYGDGLRKWKKPHVMRTQHYLMHQVESELIAELHDEIGKLSHKVTVANMDRETAAKETDADKKRITALEGDLSKTKAELNLSGSREQVSAAAKRTLELDIAKIRQAVGDLRMKEILEGRAS